MSSVQALTVFMVVLMAAGSLVYLDTTQSLGDQLSSLQSQVASMQAARVTSDTQTQAQSPTVGHTVPTVHKTLTLYGDLNKLVFRQVRRVRVG